MEPGHMMFGTELRRRRIEAGYSLTDMIKIVHYSKSHLSKVETGAKAPSPYLVRTCDAALGCDGALIELASTASRNAAVPTGTSAGEMRGMRLDGIGDSDLVVTTRRELIAAGLLGGTAGLTDRPRTVCDPAVPRGWADGGAASALEHFRLIFEQVRGLGQHVSPGLLIPILVTHTYALSSMAAKSHGADRIRALLLAARFAEFTGWIAQEGGLDSDATQWTERAVELADAGGDPGMSAYAQVRRALITMYQGDAQQTIALAQAAQRATCRPRILGLAAQREAQGHALAGNQAACFTALDRARELLVADPATHDEPVLGSSHVPDPVTAATGWSLFDLGRPREAAQVLRGELGQIPDHARRTRARYGARLALALAHSKQLDEACTVALQVLDANLQVQSATIRVDLRDLLQVLRRWHNHPAASRVCLDLIETLGSSHRRHA